MMRRDSSRQRGEIVLDLVECAADKGLAKEIFQAERRASQKKQEDRQRMSSFSNHDLIWFRLRSQGVIKSELGLGYLPFLLSSVELSQSALALRWLFFLRECERRACMVAVNACLSASPASVVLHRTGSGPKVVVVFVFFLSYHTIHTFCGSKISSSDLK